MKIHRALGWLYFVGMMAAFILMLILIGGSV
jgi:hypothetical protein